MSIFSNNQNIESINHGEDALAKVYVGEDLVFEHDKPVWMVHTKKGYWYSLDGINYTKIHTYTSSGSRGLFPCYANKRFWFASPESNSQMFKTSDIKEGTFSPTNFRGDSYSVASNGDNVLCMSTRSTNNLYYSLDGGQSWSSINVGYMDFELKYIGDNQFFITGTDGKWFYWDANNPGIFYSVTMTNTSNKIVNVWRCNDNDGHYYIQIKNGNNYEVYKSTSKNTLGTQISTGTLADFVYCYNKYYSINATPGEIRSGSVYISDDGITFTQLTGANGIDFIQKTNGKLTFVAGVNAYTPRKAGVIHSDGTIESADLGTSDDYIDGSMVCNRFPKI